MTKPVNNQRRRIGRTGFAAVVGSAVAAALALAASLAPASATAKAGADGGSVLERRIEAVRAAADAAALKPGGQDIRHTAQWRNWPNWPNFFRNFWNNWPNSWFNR